MIKFLCFILTFEDNVKHDEMSFSIYCIHVLRCCVDPKKLQLTTVLFLNVLLLKRKPILVRLEVTNSYFIEILSDYERRIAEEESEVLLSRQRQTPELE